MKATFKSSVIPNEESFVKMYVGNLVILDKFHDDRHPQSDLSISPRVLKSRENTLAIRTNSQGKPELLI